MKIVESAKIAVTFSEISQSQQTDYTRKTASRSFEMTGLNAARRASLKKFVPLIRLSCL
jgi:hypothetical protein